MAQWRATVERRSLNPLSRPIADRPLLSTHHVEFEAADEDEAREVAKVAAMHDIHKRFGSPSGDCSILVRSLALMAPS